MRTRACCTFDRLLPQYARVSRRSLWSWANKVTLDIGNADGRDGSAA